MLLNKAEQERVLRRLLRGKKTLIKRVCNQHFPQRMAGSGLSMKAAGLNPAGTGFKRFMSKVIGGIKKAFKNPTVRQISKDVFMKVILPMAKNFIKEKLASKGGKGLKLAGMGSIRL